MTAHCARVRIVNERGLHARASAKFVNLVTAQYDHLAITVSKDNAEASGGSILGLMMLGAARRLVILAAFGPRIWLKRKKACSSPRHNRAGACSAIEAKLSSGMDFPSRSLATTPLTRRGRASCQAHCRHCENRSCSSAKPLKALKTPPS